MTPSPSDLRRLAAGAPLARLNDPEAVQALLRELAAVLERTGTRRPRGSRRRGQAHPRAKCSDAEVALARDFVLVHGASIAWVARKFDVAESTVRDWIGRRTRG